MTQAEQEKMEMQVWDYIDGTCATAEANDIARLVATDKQWQHCYESLYSLHINVNNSIEEMQPSLRFTKNVMETVGSSHIFPAVSKYINPVIIKSIAAFFILSISILAVYLLFSVNWHTQATYSVFDFNFHWLTLDSQISETAINTAIAINIILALVIADLLLRRKRKYYTRKS